MSNTFLTPSVIAKRVLGHIKNNCVMGGLVNREFKNEFKKVGETISIRKPVKFESGEGADVTNRIQDITELNTTITVDKHRNVPIIISGADLAMKVEDIDERYLKPAAIKLANDIDYDLTGLATSLYGYAGTAGVTPNSFTALADAGTLADNMGIPEDNRNLIVNPAAKWKLADALKGTFEAKGASDFLRKGLLGKIANLDINSSQNVRTHTHNTLTGTPVIDTVSGVTYITGDTAITSTVHVDGISAGAVAAGDVFTIAGVYSVNPVSKQTTGQLQQFTVTATVAQATDMPLVVSPAIRASGPYQTVTAAPADGAAVTFVDTHVANILFNKDAFALVTVPFENLGPGVEMTTMNYDGYSITVTMAADGLKFLRFIRLDVLYGVKCIYPEYGLRLLG